MKLSKIRHRIYRKAWVWWHCDWRSFFDSLGHRYWPGGPTRPWWHMCCNGDEFGWRTKVCDHLEEYWRTSPHEYNERA